MKKILGLFLLMFCSFNSFCQEDNYPKYYIQNGDTVGVIYSIKQVQRIYNDEVLLSLLKDVRTGCDSVIEKYLVIVNQYEQKQLINKSLIDQYENSMKEHKLELNTYKKKVQNLELEVENCGVEKDLKDGQIKNNRLIIDKIKTQRNWLFGGTVGFGVLSLFLLGVVFGN